jgi:phosphatidylserine/phosphatidylglycerophosphate/cardiolipin synthase-like enzyme
MSDITGTYRENDVGPLSGWRVEVWRLDRSRGWVLAVDTATDSAGNFTFTIPFLGALLLGIATVEVRLVDAVRRVAHRSTFILPVSGTHSLGTMTVPSANLRGWRATNLDPGGAFPHFSTNNSVEPLIDNADAWSALHSAIENATQELALQLFYFDINFVFLTFTQNPVEGTPTTGTRLEEDLLAANRTRQVAVRLLIRDHSSIPYPIDTADQVVNYFATATPPSPIEVRRFETDPRLPMHAKFIIVDGTEAHITASPFLQEYFDGSGHLVDDPRRGPLSAFGVTDLLAAMAGSPWWPAPIVVVHRLSQAKKNAIRTPVHDVGARVRGDAVKDIHDTFFLHWNTAGSPASSTLVPVPPPAPHSAVQMVRSLPGDTFAALPNGEATILEAYLRCFAEARDFIYLENQYLTEFLIFDAIRLSLRETQDLQVILLINHKVDIPSYGGWQAARLNQLEDKLTEDGTIDRFKVFSLWSHEQIGTKQYLLSNYVHSKLAIADDHWVTLGSANLDGVSLMTGEHLAPLVFVPGMENRRSTELNVTVFDGIDQLGPSTVPGELRRALWAEHLGLSGPGDPLLATRPAGGWLSLWKSRADAKMSGLKASPPTTHPCRVLEWRPAADPERYLKALGIDIRPFGIMEEFRGFDFASGTWQRNHE